MSYSARAIANYFLDLAEAEGKSISPLKIQKLVFIAHGWHLALLDAPLVEDEFAEAWDYGPVFPSLYHAFKQFGRGPIKDRATRFEVRSAADFDITKVVPKVRQDDTQTALLLMRIWEAYGKLSGLQLSDMTHAPNTPWQQTRDRVGDVRNADIENDVIKEHYKKMAEQNRQRREQRASA